MFSEEQYFVHTGHLVDFEEGDSKIEQLACLMVGVGRTLSTHATTFSPTCIKNLYY